MSALPDRIPFSGRLTFEEEPHLYTLDGEVIPGITSILKAARLLDDSFYSVEARERGVAVHLAIQYLIEGDLQRDSLAPLILPYVEAWERFAIEMHWQPVEAPELLVGSEVLRFATRIDGIGRVNGSPLLVVNNWKSGGPEPWHAVQSAGEAVAYAETTGRATTYGLRRAALYLRNDGTYRWHEHETKCAGRDVDDFRAAARVYHCQERFGRRARKET